MKRLKQPAKYMLLGLAILLPQLFIRNYFICTGIFVLLGFLLGHWNIMDKIFWKVFLIELVIISSLFFLIADPSNKQYLFNLLASVELPAFILPTLVLLFNAFNVAICMVTGWRSSKLII